MTKTSKASDKPLICAPHKAPGKPKDWQFPKSGHSAGYKGKYASNGRFAEDARR